ncbi:hypothetical protein [Lacrimispora sp.]|uniref:hypothetical protein n=1 Tax=Lacrimispora sp. TaxID=2719234 RepID=UPI0039E60252
MNENGAFFTTLFQYALLFGALLLDQSLDAKEKQSIMAFLHIYNIESFQLMYIFVEITFLSALFIIRPISKYIVLKDNKIFIKHLKGINYYYSFYGMANLILSLLMIFASIFLGVQYSTWKDINIFTVMCVIFMMMSLSVLAGQRDYYVSITRRKHIIAEKIYYRDVDGKDRLIDIK